MDLMNIKSVELESIRMQANYKELAERIGRAVSSDGLLQVLPGLNFHRETKLIDPSYDLTDPCLSVIVQGSKELLLGDKRFRLEPGHYLLAAAAMPVTSKLIEASRKNPYLSLRLKLDPELVSSVIMEAGLSAPKTNPNIQAAIDVCTLDADLLDAVVRLVRLVEQPAQAKILAPLVTREIVYRLLLGAQSQRLRYLAGLGNHFQSILKVLDRLKLDYDKPFRIEEIADDIGMSVSGFYQHFKAFTAMSPTQYQKQLRLQEARRLILTEKLDAASAGLRVGYYDASHFSREYKSLFGKPPMRDAEQLRAVAR